MPASATPQTAAAAATAARNREREPHTRDLLPPDPASLLHLGGDRRGSRGALRRRPRLDRALRPEHLAGATRPRRAPPRRGPLRVAALGVPAVRLPPAHRGRR